MKNFNDYDPDKFKLTFQNTELYTNVVKNADIVFWGKSFSSRDSFTIFSTDTPREKFSKKVITISSFYYLQFLTEVSPSNIYDIGCGMNYFKNYIPSIIGIDAEIKDGKIVGDVYGRFNDNFVLKNKFDSAFSINALHFIPLPDLRQRILDFVSIINTGGRGFLALNSQRLLDNTSADELALVFPNGITTESLDSYIRSQFDNIEDIKFLCVDIDLSVPDEWMDGNIRVVFEKISKTS
jgi:hypothetical protein